MKDKIFTIIFIVIIFIPSLVALSGLYDFTTNEKRQLAKFPDRISVTEFEAFYNDHYAFKKELVALNTEYKNAMGNYFLSDYVIKGKDGWLFYTIPNANFDPVTNLIGENLFPDERMKNIADNLQNINEDLKKEGIDFYLLIPPNKSDVYTEYLPTLMQNKEYNKLDQTIEYLGKNTDVKTIDVREELIKGKENGETYYKTDTHWNQLGAFLAYQKIMKTFDMDYHEYSEYIHTVKTVKKDNSDLLNLLSYSAYSREEEVLTPKFKTQSKYLSGELDTDKIGVYTINDNSKKNLMIYRDSYGIALFPFLAEHFNKTISSWTFKVNMKEILDNSPDIVILEVLERNLGYMEETTTYQNFTSNK